MIMMQQQLKLQQEQMQLQKEKMKLQKEQIEEQMKQQKEQMMKMIDKMATSTGVTNAQGSTVNTSMTPAFSPFDSTSEPWTDYFARFITVVGDFYLELKLLDPSFL